MTKKQALQKILNMFDGIENAVASYHGRSIEDLATCLNYHDNLFATVSTKVECISTIPFEMSTRYSLLIAYNKWYEVEEMERLYNLVWDWNCNNSNIVVDNNGTFNSKPLLEKLQQRKLEIQQEIDRIAA